MLAKDGGAEGQRVCRANETDFKLTLEICQAASSRSTLYFRMY